MVIGALSATKTAGQETNGQNPTELKLVRRGSEMQKQIDPERVDETPLWCFRLLPLGDAAAVVLLGIPEAMLELGAGAVREALIPPLLPRVALAGTKAGTRPVVGLVEEKTMSRRGIEEDIDDTIRTMQDFLQLGYFLLVSLPRLPCLLQLQ